MSFRTAREKAGKSVADVMAALHVSDAAVYYWETGKNKPTAARCVDIAKLYGCTVDELLKEERGENNDSR